VPRFEPISSFLNVAWQQNHILAGGPFHPHPDGQKHSLLCSPCKALNAAALRWKRDELMFGACRLCRNWVIENIPVGNHCTFPQRNWLPKLRRLHALPQRPLPAVQTILVDRDPRFGHARSTTQTANATPLAQEKGLRLDEEKGAEADKDSPAKSCGHCSGAERDLAFSADGAEMLLCRDHDCG